MLDVVHPWALALMLLPAAGLLVRARRRGRGRPVVRWPSLSGFVESPRGWRVRTTWVPSLVRWFGIVLVVAALARPRAGEVIQSVTTEGMDIVLVLDTSGSMLTEDMERGGVRANRMDAAKSVAADFVGRRPGDRVGLVTFDEISIPRCPPTLDHEVLLSLLDDVRVTGEDARTALGTALASAINRLRDSPAESRVIILVTDGRSTAGRTEPLDAAEMARLLGVRIHAIGVGSEGEAPYPVEGRFGLRGYRMVRSDIDVATLERISATTGGRHYRAERGQQLERVFADLDALEPSVMEVDHRVEHRELFPWLARAASLALVLAVAGVATAWRTAP